MTKPTTKQIQALIEEYPRLDWLMAETLLMTYANKNVGSTSYDDSLEPVDLHRQRDQYNQQPRSSEDHASIAPVLGTGVGQNGTDSPQL